MRLAGAKLADSRDVLVTSSGQVLAADTGETLAREPANFPAWQGCLPALDGGRLFLATSYQMAGLDLWLEETGRVCTRTAWRFPRGYWIHSAAEAPIVADDRLVAMRYCGHHFDHQPIPLDTLYLCDPASGQHLTNVQGVLSEVESPATISLAGERLIATDSGPRIWGKTVEHRLSSIQWGEHPRVLAVARFPRSRANPAFAGPRMFIAGEGMVMAVERRGEAGLIQDRQAMAEMVLKSIPARPETVVLTVDIPPFTGLDPEPDLPMEPQFDGRMPTTWLVLGPIPSADGDLAGAIGDPVRFLARPGTRLSLGGKEHAFAPLDGQVLLWGGANVDRMGLRWKSRGATIDLLRLMGKGQQAVLLFTVLIVDQAKVLQYRCRTPQTTAWLAGRHIESDVVLRLKAGYYPFLLHVVLPRLPPGGVRPMLEATLMRIQDPAQLARAWLAAVEPRRSDLQRIIADLPNTEQCFRAKRILTHYEQDTARQP